MLIRNTTQAVRAVAEHVGIIAPSVPDATQAAEEHRRNLVAAQSAREAAEQALQAAHDRAADEGEVKRLEAALAAAKIELSRAESRYVGAEKRLATATAAESKAAKGEAREKLKIALDTRTQAALEIDRLAELLGEQVRRLDSQGAELALAIKAGVAPRDVGTILKGERVAELALSRHRAVPRAYWGDPTRHPGAADVVARENGSLLPEAEASGEEKQ